MHAVVPVPNLIKGGGEADLHFTLGHRRNGPVTFLIPRLRLFVLFFPSPFFITPLGISRP